MLALALAAAVAAAAPDPEAYIIPPSRCYSESSFAFDRSEGDVTIRIAGTITAPVGRAPRATVVMITGSGDHVRDQMISGVPMFGLIADFLARAGFNVVRTDARGFGASTVNGENLRPAEWMQVITPKRYADNWALLDHLAGRAEIAGTPLVLLGHSEGAMIAGRLAADRSDVDLAVLLATSAAPGREVFARQRTNAAIRDGAPAGVAEELHGLLLEFAAFLTQDPTNDARYEVLVNDFLAAQSPLPEPLFGRGFLEFHRNRSPWHIYFMGYDPYPDLSRIKSPVIALYGERDDATDWRVHAPILTKAMSAAENGDYSLHILPDQDHFFLEFEGRRVDRHPFGRTRISTELRDTLLDQLGLRFAASEPPCEG